MNRSTKLDSMSLSDSSPEVLPASSQLQDDGKVHPVAYANRALSDPEKHYAVTELEILAVVWALNHFTLTCMVMKLLYVYTDYSAVKAVFETPNPSAKHARWWNKVYGSGVKSMT